MPSDHDATRQRVRQQYERFPYPTPQHDLQPFVDGQALELGYPGAFFHKYWPRAQRTTDLDILVAGCGSTQAARYAAAHPEARVTGIDLSEASLAHSRKLADRFGLGNLTLQRLPVEEAGNLRGEFDLIVATGVIHHLPEPEAGLRALKPLLRSDGAMHIMLYAPYGRDAIYYLQALMREAGISIESVTSKDVPELVRLVDTLPGEHPLWHRRRQFPDLRQGPELVDYLLHPQDRAYTLRQSRDMLGACGLELQDVFNRAHYAPRCFAMGSSPLFQSLDELDEFEQFDLGEIYRASVTRHDLIACRADRPPEERRVKVGEDWQSIVPVAMPGVRGTSGGLPQGKHQWLQSPAHAFADLRLAVDEKEEAFYSAIDSARSVADILGTIAAPGLSDNPSRVTALLELLFDYDLAWLRSA